MFRVRETATICENVARLQDHFLSWKNEDPDNRPLYNFGGDPSDFYLNHAGVDRIAATPRPMDTDATVVTGWKVEQIDGVWTQTWTVHTRTVGELIDHLSLVAKEKLALLADRRYHVETAGLLWVKPGTSEVYGIATDREASQGKLHAERYAADQGTRRDDDEWKCLNVATGKVDFIPLTNAQIINMTNATRTMISDAFNNEAVHSRAIDALTDVGEDPSAEDLIAACAAVRAYSIESGW